MAQAGLKAEPRLCDGREIEVDLTRDLDRVARERDDDDEASSVGDDSDERVSGRGADRAARVAAEVVGGGRVVAVEREDEAGVAWEVEVVRPGGRQVEVELTRSFERAAVERDDDGRDDDDD